VVASFWGYWFMSITRATARGTLVIVWVPACLAGRAVAPSSSFGASAVR
jgi:hypothetical protein